MNIRLAINWNDWLVGFAWTDPMIRATGWCAVMFYFGPIVLIVEKKRHA